jgi:maltose O-acetyltransferase
MIPNRVFARRLLRPALRELSTYVAGILSGFLASSLIPRRARPQFLRMLGHRGVASRCVISEHCVFSGWSSLAVGQKSYINNGVHFDLSAPISIGANVHVGPGTAFVTSTHDLGIEDRRAGAVFSGEIRVGDGCWLGARVVVLPGVRIGSGIVVAAGAVVTRSLMAPGIYGGTPARLIREF